MLRVAHMLRRRQALGRAGSCGSPFVGCASLGLCIGLLASACGKGEEAPKIPMPTAAQLAETLTRVDQGKGPPGAPLLGAAVGKLGALRPDSFTTYRADGSRLRMVQRAKGTFRVGGQPVEASFGIDARDTIRHVEFRQSGKSKAECDQMGIELGIAYGLPVPQEDGAYVWAGSKVYVRWYWDSGLLGGSCVMTWDQAG